MSEKHNAGTDKKNNAIDNSVCENKERKYSLFITGFDFDKRSKLLEILVLDYKFFFTEVNELLSSCSEDHPIELASDLSHEKAQEMCRKLKEVGADIHIA